MTTVTMTKMAEPRLLAQISYKIRLDGELIGYVSRKRHEYDADRYNPRTRFARMVTATVWVYEEPARPGRRFTGLTYDTRKRAVANLLADRLGKRPYEVEGLVPSKVTAEPTP